MTDMIKSCSGLLTGSDLTTIQDRVYRNRVSRILKYTVILQYTGPFCPHNLSFTKYLSTLQSSHTQTIISGELKTAVTMDSTGLGRNHELSSNNLNMLTVLTLFIFLLCIPLPAQRQYTRNSIRPRFLSNQFLPAPIFLPLRQLFLRHFAAIIWSYFFLEMVHFLFLNIQYFFFVL